MNFDVIGKTVSYWAGGDFGYEAKILRHAKPIEKRFQYKLFDSLREQQFGPYFLAKNIKGGKLVIIRPTLYYHTTLSKMKLEIHWELVHDCNPKNGEDITWEDKPITGFEYD
jgi:hypothetical protein